MFVPLRTLASAANLSRAANFPLEEFPRQPAELWNDALEERISAYRKRARAYQLMINASR